MLSTVLHWLSANHLQRYDCKKAVSDNLVEAVQAVGTEGDVALEHAQSG